MALVGHWKLDGNALDSSGYGHHGVETNVVYASGKLGQCYENDAGAARYVTISNAAMLQTNWDMSLAMWLYPTSNAVRRNPWNKAYGGEGTITHEISGQVKFYWGTAGGNTSPYTNLVTRRTLPLNEWSHICLVRHAGEMVRWYINGAVDNMSKDPYTSATASPTSIRIGDGYTGNEYLGRIDDVRLFNHAISTEEVHFLARDAGPTVWEEKRLKQSKLFHLGTGVNGLTVDGTGRGSQVKNVDTVANFAAGGRHEWAPVFFQDSNQLIEVHQGNLGFPYTFHVRFKLFSTGTNYTPFSTPYGRIRVLSDNRIQFIWNRSATGDPTIESTTTVQAGTWYSATVTHDGLTGKLYVNGSLEGSRAEDNAGIINACQIGRLWGSTQPMYGLVEDVQIFAEALPADEVAELSNTPQVTIDSDQQVVLSGIDDEIEWTLMDNWISDLDAGFTPHDSALGGVALNSIADMQAAGWTTYLSVVESSRYTRKRGYCQMYYGSSPYGTIEKALPAGYEYVKVVWGNWYSSGSDGGRIYLGGALVHSLLRGSGYDVWASKYNPGDTIKFWENGIIWIGQIWVGNKRTTPRISKTGIAGPIRHDRNRSLIDYRTWVPGTTGTQTGFSASGDANQIIWGGDPWGHPTAIWQSVNNDVASNADGGWNTPSFPIDHTAMYRFSVWVQRHVLGNGHFYFGAYGYNAGGNDGLIRASDGVTATTNPYFEVNSNWGEWGDLELWYLVVAYIWPSSYAGGTVGPHPLSGIYNGWHQGRVDTTEYDYIWKTTNLYGRHRTYLYYSTDPSTDQRWCYPRVDKVDGTEPMLYELLSGHAYHHTTIRDRSWPGSNIPLLADSKGFMTARKPIM